jgi:copper chaperone CopZ
MNFRIGKVTCSGCTNNIEKNIKQAFADGGLLDVTATVLTNRMSVRVAQYARGYITPEAIEGIVVGIGKECEFLDIKDINHSGSQNKRSFKKILKSDEGM